jgi:outer membrane protein
MISLESRMRARTHLLPVAPLLVAAFAMTAADSAWAQQAQQAQPRLAHPSHHTAPRPPRVAPSHADVQTSLVVTATKPTSGQSTLAGALAAAYANNPTLQAARAQLRSVDENVPQALSGWRPTVVLAGTAGYGDGMDRLSGRGGGTTATRNDRLIATAQATLTQPIYRGGRTRSQTNRAENQVRAQRAALLSQEQTTLSAAVNAYVNVIQTRQILQLDINNEQVLTRQLQATNDRFRVGEITRTDVAQAEASLAGAKALRETAEGNVATAQATFQQIIGYFPPNDLVEPQPIAIPLRTELQASTIAAANNPNVVSAEFTEAAARDAIDVAYSALMPNLSLQGTTFQNENATLAHNSVNGYQIVASLSVPLYQGGSEYSLIRQARQTEEQNRKMLDDARRLAQQQAISAWETLVAARATANSTRTQIRANEIALEGTEREAIVGSRTTLDVLNAQQALLNSQVTLVQNLAALVTASYSLAAAVGRLTADDLNLQVPRYDPRAYYRDVRDKWFGTGDYATDQPGR